MRLKELPKFAVIDHIRAILSYQYGDAISDAFLAPVNEMEFKFSNNTGKIKYINLKGQLQATYRSELGTFIFTPEAADRVYQAAKFPKFRVQVQNDVAEFIRQGKSVFAKHVIMIDPNLHIGDEVFVVDENDKLLAIGKLELPPCYFPDIKMGSAVKVRKGFADQKT